MDQYAGTLTLDLKDLPNAVHDPNMYRDHIAMQADLLSLVVMRT